MLMCEDSAADADSKRDAECSVLLCGTDMVQINVVLHMAAMILIHQSGAIRGVAGPTIGTTAWTSG
jgi:hypothetical protein